MCRRMLQKMVAGIALAVALMIGSQAEALTLNFNYNYSGDAPTGPVPWLTAEFTQLNPNLVQLTMSEVNLTDQEFVSDWYFNFNPSKNADDLLFIPISGFPAVDVHTVPNNASNDIQADGGGLYDIRFEYPTSAGNRFGVGDSAVYYLQYLGSGMQLAESDFAWLAEPHGDNGVYYAAAHIQGIGPNAEDSGWIGAELVPPVQPVPEPSTLILLGAGLAGVIFRRRVKCG